MIKIHNVKAIITMPLVILGVTLLTTGACLGSASRTSSLDEVARELKTPKALEKFMRNNFTYVEDRFLLDVDEYWQGAQEMLVRRQGDCEDYAVFTKAILERMGYRVFLLSLYSGADAHTVTVFEKNGRVGVFDLDKLLTPRSDSLGRIASEVNSRWDSLGIMRQSGNIGLISRKFLKKSFRNISLMSVFEYLTRSTLRPVL